MSTETTKTRKIKTAAERAADALALEQGRVDALIRRRDTATKALQKAQADSEEIATKLVEAIAARDYAAGAPALRETTEAATDPAQTSIDDELDDETLPQGGDV